jgi:predicted AlkP superfamily pyrophosphatase or phosphodiesterase
VDGLRADAAERWAAPTLLRLAREGAAQLHTRAVAPTLTAPGHLSLLSGVRPSAHGVYGDELEYTKQMADLDPIFRYASRRGQRTVAFMSREGPLAQFERALACRLAFGLDSLYLTAPSAARVVDEASDALAEKANDLVFLHLPDPDLAGHRYGFTSPQYGAAVLAVDAALERVRAAVSAIPGTLLIVTSDHGGGGAWGPYQHGSGSPEDVEVPLLMWGARVAPGALPSTSLLDVAPTVLWALGMSPPSSYEGRPLLEGFR